MSVPPVTIPPPTGLYRLLRMFPDDKRSENVVAINASDLSVAKLGLQHIGAQWVSSKPPKINNNTKKEQRRSILFLDEVTMALFYSDGKLGSVIMAEAQLVDTDHPGDLKVKKGEPA